MGSERLRHRVLLAVSAVLLCTVLSLSCGRGEIELPEPEIIEGAEMRFSPGANRASLIDWEPWGRQAFERAGRQERPVVLVMTALPIREARQFDETTLSDSLIIERLNRECVPIRVDIERHPEVKRLVWSGALVPKEGEPGIVSIHASGQLIQAAGFLDPPGTEEFLDYAVETNMFYERWPEGPGQAPVIAWEQPLIMRRRVQTRELSNDLVDRVAASLRSALSGPGGGPGQDGKVRDPSAISLLLYLGHTRGEESLAVLASDALVSVREAGYWDEVEGGVSGPGGKNLAINADLALSYLEAWEATGKEDHPRAARDILRFLLTVLYDENIDAFRAGQLGDEAYFALDRAGRSEAGAAPPVDGTLYTDRNARMVSLGLKAGLVLQNETWTERALGLLDDLWDRAVGEDGRVYHVFDIERGAGSAPGLVADGMWLARALLDAYAYTGVPRYLLRARQLVDRALEEQWQETADVFVAHSGESWPPAAALVNNPSFDANLVGALVLLRLNWCTEEPMYRDVARRILTRWSGDWGRFGDRAGAYGLALQRYLDYPVRMMIIGSPEEAQTRALLRESLRLYEPGKHVQLLDPKSEREEVEARGFPTDMDPAIFVCVGRACSAPILDAEEVAASVSSFVEQMGRE
ncbi:hypothetical protein AMJ82_11935 [candidate division TA06 bacterium SM23_40]|uniref:Spermatogenesis-associated protein 20-like TRX domain-containing protein n=1 Tax=candidate division TA06 bacterium SM23_40 TaxID=1703774 RepID=A0A0S8G079_UNCT6|nr:MAG: hypothetical protein AMJ82_11935 [candidate division TA06 bacterium SM23_40]